MSESTGVTCQNCHARYFPDLDTRGPWICTACRAKNANLKRHYRSIAIFFILIFIGWVLFEAVIDWELFLKRILGLEIRSLLDACQLALLVVTGVLIYRSKEPWNDKTAKALIGTVFVLWLVHWVVWGQPSVFAAVICVIIGWYLIWLHIQTKRALR